jgi:uncharacterized membrane protein
MILVHVYTRSLKNSKAPCNNRVIVITRSEENMMLFFDDALMYIRDGISAIGVVIITVGALRGIYQLYMLAVRKQFSTNYIRLQFGNSVVLGLEFMVGGDIVGSLVKPDYYTLGMLAIIVLIRTILSYFLNLELAALTPQQQEALK